MADWPMYWRDDRKLMERICKCGVGHPDPDHLAYKERLIGPEASADAVHGCCGCCSKPSLENFKVQPGQVPSLADLRLNMNLPLPYFTSDIIPPPPRIVAGFLKPAPPVPPPPLSRIIKEGDTATKCRLCGSSRYKAKWYSRKGKHCIQPDCSNYLIRALVRTKRARFKSWIKRFIIGWLGKDYNG